MMETRTDNWLIFMMEAAVLRMLRLTVLMVGAIMEDARSCVEGSEKWQMPLLINWLPPFSDMFLISIILSVSDFYVLVCF